MGMTTWVEVDGAVLAADVEAGDDAPLVFLHAGVADRRMWQPQWDAFATHARLRYDRRGFGDSRTARAVRHSRIADLWAVMDAAGMERAVLVGCSQGGRVAIDAALSCPQRVSGLVLVAPAVTGAPEPVLDAAVQALSDAIDAASERGDIDAVNRLEAQLWLDGPASPGGRVGGAQRELFLAMNDIALRAADPGEPIEEASAWDRLGRIGVPTLLLWGDLDLPHLQSRCDEMLRRIPNAQRVVLAGTAHLPGLESPRRFAEAMARHLASL